MNWIHLLVTLLLLQGRIPQDRAEDRAFIQGIVVKIGTGEPVSKALVTLTRVLDKNDENENYSATTAADGKFYLDCSPGSTSLAQPIREAPLEKRPRRAR